MLNPTVLRAGRNLGMQPVLQYPRRSRFAPILLEKMGIYERTVTACKLSVPGYCQANGCRWNEPLTFVIPYRNIYMTAWQ